MIDWLITLTKQVDWNRWFYICYSKKKDPEKCEYLELYFDF